MYNIILIFFFVVSILLIFFIMLQQEHHNDLKSSFISNNIFTSRSHESFINKIIKILASFFILISLLLNNFNNYKIKENKWENLESSTNFTDENYIKDIPN